MAVGETKVATKAGAGRVGREPVVRAGLKLLDAVGLEGLTLRAIAAELGVQAPTLYWRFKNKQDLIDEMATQVLADGVAQGAQAAAPACWQDGILDFGVALRASLLRYRDGARMVAGSHLTDTSVYAGMERMLRVFADAGISPADGMACLLTAYAYVIGFTIEEQAVVSPAGARDPRYGPELREAKMDPAAFPLGRSVSAEMFADYDGRFARGLRMIVAGFAAELG